MACVLDTIIRMAIAHPNEDEFFPHAKIYVDLVPPGDVIESLASQIDKTVALLKPIGDKRATVLAYAPGKWTVKQAIGHMSDTERIFGYRALRIARGDTTPLPGFEQDDYVPNAGSNERTLDDLLQELLIVRQSTLALVRSF